MANDKEKEETKPKGTILSLDRRLRGRKEDTTALGILNSMGHSEKKDGEQEDEHLDFITVTDSNEEVLALNSLKTIYVDELGSPLWARWVERQEKLNTTVGENNRANKIMQHAQPKIVSGKPYDEDGGEDDSNK